VKLKIMGIFKYQAVKII